MQFGNYCLINWTFVGDHPRVWSLHPPQNPSPFLSGISTAEPGQQSDFNSVEMVTLKTPFLRSMKSFGIGIFMLKLV
jgi:hypothetical protein